MSEQEQIVLDFTSRCTALGPTRTRKMFGGTGIYLEDIMFALEAWNRIYLKVDRETIPVFQQAGSEPFTYEGKGKPVEMSYWLLPETTSEDAFMDWCRLAVEAARRAAQKKTKKKRS
ncbi:TfoX/Sxy family protein [Kiloniella sp. b19]|uniref:TfoX/Sxy family protein n=1 Tax=Kiloniella sp. GXU_MW_B19 TaxID=3141326 RepID=UPI0031E03ACD